MRKFLLCSCAVFSVAVVAEVSQAQEGQKPRSTIGQSLTPPAYPDARMEGALIRFPLPKDAQAYGDIDGKAIHKYVVDLAEISRHYRDSGHPKFWGRITGTTGERETDQWLMGKLHAINGLTDVRIQELPLPPQWFPKGWSVSMSGGGKTIALDSAQPDYDSTALPAAELDAIYAGLGTDADFAGKDVKGKAVFVYGMQGLANLDAVKRADRLGAAAVFEVSMLPGNMRYQAYPSGTKAPAFTMGNDDGTAARSMIAAAPTKVKVSLETERVPGLHSTMVWATLPGATDETIYITAHKDGWFDGSGDNAGGVASTLGILEHFAKIPQARRKRTIVFIALDAHHNLDNKRTGGVGDHWLSMNKAKLFTKTALMINNEHPSTITSQSRPRYYPGDEIAWGNTYMPLEWYAGGKQRPELNKIVWNSFREFGVPLEMDASPTPPASDMSMLAVDVPDFERDIAGIDAGEYHNYFHTDWETPETVPWTGLEAVTRAYAKIIDQVNEMPLDKLQLPKAAAK